MFQLLSVFLKPLECVTHLFHDPLKVTHSGGGKDCTVNVGLYQAWVGRLAVLLSRPLGVAFALAFGVLYDRQLMFFTQPVRHFPHSGIVRFAVAELSAIYRGNRIDDKMIVVMVCVQVGSNYYLELISP